MNKMRMLYALFVIIIMSLVSFSVIAHEGEDNLTEEEHDAAEALESEMEISDESALAESETVLQEELSGDAGITPDNALWGLETAMENINLALTFNEEAKARKRADIARERLLEARVMAESNKVEALEKARNAHKKHLQILRERLEKISKDNIKDEIRINAELEQKIASQEVAAEALATRIHIKIRGNLTEEQRQRLVSLIESFRNESANVKADIRAERVKAKLKLRAKESLTEEQADEIEEELEVEAEAEIKAKGKNAEVVAAEFIKIAERAVENAREKTAKIENNETKARAEFHLSNATSLLEKAKAAFEQKKYAEARNLAFQARREAHNSVIMSKGKAVTPEERGKISEEIKEKSKKRLEKARELRKEKVEERKEAVKDKVREKVETESSGKIDQEIKEVKLVIEHTAYKPDEIKVNKGDKVKILAVAARGTSSHNHGVTIDAYGINRAVTSEDADKAELIELTADKEGTFEIYCKTCWDGPFGRGHPDIKGKLVVG